MPVCGSGAVVSAWSLLIRRPQRACRQAETPLIVLCRFPGPVLTSHDFSGASPSFSNASLSFSCTHKSGGHNSANSYGFGSELEKRAKLIDKTNQRPITFF